jgi:hypothetical protein
MNRERIEELKDRFRLTFLLFPAKIIKKVITDCYEDVYFMQDDDEQRTILTQVFKELLEEFDAKSK